MRSNRLAIAVLIAVGAMVVGGGAALAGDGSGTGSQTRCDRIWERLAEKRVVTVEQLKAQWRAKVIARIDAAVKAGRLSEARAAELRAKTAASTGCLSGDKRGDRDGKRPPKFHHGGFFFASAISGYLGLSKDALVAELRSGSSLAAIAAKQGKSVDGLKALFLNPLKARLDAAVAKGRLQPEWRDSAIVRYQKFIDALVQRSFKARTAT
jgi:hypothetical protein